MPVIETIGLVTSVVRIIAVVADGLGDDVSTGLEGAGPQLERLIRGDQEVPGGRFKDEDPDLDVAQDWGALVDEVRGLDPRARSEAFVALVTRGPQERAAQGALVALGSAEGLDPDRVRWVIERLRDRDARLLAATTPELRDRFLVTFVDGADPALEAAATELLAAQGTAVALRELEGRGSAAPRSLALAKRLKARLAGGHLAVVDDAVTGGLTLPSGE